MVHAMLNNLRASECRPAWFNQPSLFYQK